MIKLRMEMGNVPKRQQPDVFMSPDRQSRVTYCFSSIIIIFLILSGSFLRAKGTNLNDGAL